MILLKNTEHAQAEKWMKEAVNAAKKSTCLRAKCGTIIVKDNKIIGSGFNSPPNNLESQRRCAAEKANYHKKITDKTCCIHAEQRAILDALSKGTLEGADLYFTRLNKDNSIAKAGKPYCTICSKLTLDAGVKNFILWHDEGICSYPTEEYNSLSYKYQE